MTRLIRGGIALNKADNYNPLHNPHYPKKILKVSLGIANPEISLPKPTYAD